MNHICKMIPNVLFLLYVASLLSIVMSHGNEISNVYYMFNIAYVVLLCAFIRKVPIL